MGPLSGPLGAGLGRPLCFRLRQVRRDSSAPPHCGVLCFCPQVPGLYSLQTKKAGSGSARPRGSRAKTSPQASLKDGPGRKRVPTQKVGPDPSVKDLQARAAVELDAFTKVKAAMDKMVGELKAEQAEELKFMALHRSLVFRTSI